MASNNDNRNKLLSALITLLLGAGIVALLLFTSLHYNYPPLDGEQDMQLLQDTIMFGGEYVEMGDFLEPQSDDMLAQNSQDAAQEQPSENNEQEAIGQNNLRDNGAIDESPQQQVTNNAQPSPMQVKEQQPKKQPAEKKTEQPKPQQPQRQGAPKPQPAPKKTTEQPKQPAAKANSETDNKMKQIFGNTGGNGAGKQGNPEGKPGAEKSMGKPGVGGLEGYTLEYFPTAKCPVAGTVVIRVNVSPTGAVTKASIVGGSVSDATTRNRCLSLARQSRFRVPVGQTIERSGTLTYTIR